MVFILGSMSLVKDTVFCDTTNMKGKSSERYFFFGFLLVTLVFVFFIFRPFLSIIVVGASLSVVLYPVYEWFRKIIPLKNGWLASLLTVVLFIIIVGGPLLGIGLIVFHQLQEVYRSLVSGKIYSLDSIANSVQRIFPGASVFNIDAKLAEFVSYITNNITNVFTATLTTLFSILLVMLTTFYFLKDGAMWRHAFLELSPLSTDQNERILLRLRNAINGIIKGYFLIALVQGTLMGIGLLIFGVPHPALWGVVAAIASMVPTVGTALISVPAILFLLVTGHTSHAIGFGIWAMLIVGTMDNLINPIIVGSKTNVPSLLILFSVLGGVVFVGPVGILIGPLAISLLYTLVNMYQTDWIPREGKEGTVL